MADTAPPSLAHSTAPTSASGGEHAELQHRMVIAPHAGRFEPDPAVGSEVHRGDRIGWLHHAGAVIDVGSPWAGRFGGHLVDDRERVRDAQPLALVHPLATPSRR